jgi:phosphotransferase system HPr-like phosphotransfer protein
MHARPSHCLLMLVNQVVTIDTLLINEQHQMRRHSLVQVIAVGESHPWRS